MQFLNRHILAFGRLFLVVFFLANSGFTLVVYNCTMAMMDCCEGSDSCTTNSCEGDDPALPSKTVTIADGTVCHAVTVAGGYRTDPSIVEKNSSPREVKIDILPAITLDCESSHTNVQPLHTPSFASKAVFSPPVEKYVLNETFLI